MGNRNEQEPAHHDVPVISEEMEIETRFHFCKLNCIKVVSPVYSFILLFSITLKIRSVSCWVVLKRQRVAALPLIYSRRVC